MIKISLPFSTTFRTYWENIRASYWFIPSCMILFAFIFGYLCITRLPGLLQDSGFSEILISVPAPAAAALTSTMATAIITATSIAFSMTLVALTMASSQFGPRLLQTFMDDRGTQIVLGSLCSSFIFCLFVLHRMGVPNTSEDVSSLMALAVLIIGVTDTLLLIYFIHHIARFIQVDEIIERCYQTCLANIGSLFPQPENNVVVEAIPQSLIKPPAYTTNITLPSSGYVQTINYTALFEFNKEYVEGFEIHARGGDYVMAKDCVITVFSIHPLPDSYIDEIRKAIVLGKRRTSIQDPEFAISQLVEIALRALSPGINDPITAMTCADRLTSSCIQFADKTFPADAVINKKTDIWLLRRTFTYPSIVDTAFDQIRQAGADHVDVILHLLFCLSKLQAATDNAFTSTINAQIEATRDLGLKHVISEKDRMALMAAYKAAIRLN